MFAEVDARMSEVGSHNTQLLDPDSPEHPPKPLESEYRLRKILIAAAVQGAIFTVVRALINRGGARVFERWTGEWPGD